jgi:hypothetical protein
MEARWPSLPIGPKESLKTTGAESVRFGGGGVVKPFSGTVSRDFSPSLAGGLDIFASVESDRVWFFLADEIGSSTCFVKFALL